MGMDSSMCLNNSLNQRLAGALLWTYVPKGSHSYVKMLSLDFMSFGGVVLFCMCLWVTFGFQRFVSLNEGRIKLLEAIFPQRLFFFNLIFWA